MVSLIFNSTPVSFGAAGTPLLGAVNSLTVYLESVGTERFTVQLTNRVALLHSSAGVFVPLIGLCFWWCFFGKERS